MLKESCFVCVLSFSPMNEKPQKVTYSYVDQLPVSEIIHQVRDPHKHQGLWGHSKPHEQAHADMTLTFLTSILFIFVKCAHVLSLPIFNLDTKKQSYEQHLPTDHVFGLFPW